MIVNAILHLTDLAVVYHDICHRYGIANIGLEDEERMVVEDTDTCVRIACEHAIAMNDKVFHGDIACTVLETEYCAAIRLIVRHHHAAFCRLRHYEIRRWHRRW